MGRAGPHRKCREKGPVPQAPDEKVVPGESLGSLPGRILRGIYEIRGYLTFILAAAVVGVIPADSSNQVRLSIEQLRAKLGCISPSPEAQEQGGMSLEEYADYMNLLSADEKTVFEVDGVEVMTTSVDPEVFKKAYEKAKKVTGGFHWQPGRIIIEDSPNHPNMLKRLRQFRVAGVVLSDPKSGVIFSDEKSLPHELVHFMMGPTPDEFPVTLSEFVACGASAETQEVPYEDLDRPWIQVATDRNIQSMSMLGHFRYLAMEAVAKKHMDKLPAICKAAVAQASSLTYENLPEFLAQFGIDHKVFHPGESGEQQTLIKVREEDGKDYYLYLRYTRKKGDVAEVPWKGRVRYEYLDIDGNKYVSDFFEMNVFTYIAIPENVPHELIHLKVVTDDGEFGITL